MTHKPGTRETSSPDSTAPSTPGEGPKPIISSSDFLKLWMEEVPKVVEAHKEHHRQVRESLLGPTG